MTHEDGVALLGKQGAPRGREQSVGFSLNSATRNQRMFHGGVPLTIPAQISRRIGIAHPCQWETFSGMLWTVGEAKETSLDGTQRRTFDVNRRQQSPRSPPV